MLSVLNAAALLIVFRSVAVERYHTVQCGQVGNIQDVTNYTEKP